MATLLVVGVFAVTFLIVVAVLRAGEERNQVRAALRSLEDHDLPANMRDRQMLASLRERVLLPAASRVAALTGRFTPTGYTAQVRQKLVCAGSPAGLDPDRFLALKVLGAVSVVLWIPVVPMLGFDGFMRLMVTGILWYGAFAYPDIYIGRKTQERQHEIAIKLPDVLDMLVISVEAGLGLEQAIDRTVSTVPGALSDEFSRMLADTRVGSTRAEALRALDERTQVPELRSFILAMLQADTFGVSVGRILRSQAEEMRVRRRQRAQEKAMKAPVKMLFPLIFCIFPSLFVVIIGPGALNIARSL
jgi:tight adherence protein C